MALCPTDPSNKAPACTPTDEPSAVTAAARMGPREASLRRTAWHQHTPPARAPGVPGAAADGACSITALLLVVVMTTHTRHPSTGTLHHHHHFIHTLRQSLPAGHILQCCLPVTGKHRGWTQQAGDVPTGAEHSLQLWAPHTPSHRVVSMVSSGVVPSLTPLSKAVSSCTTNGAATSRCVSSISTVK